MDYIEAFNRWCDLTDLEGDFYKIVDVSKCLVINTYDNDNEVETLTIGDMVKNIKEKLATYYNDEFDVYYLRETDNKQWQKEVNELKAFIEQYTIARKDKYKVICKLCKSSWNYTRKCRVVNEYKDINCPICKKKTLELIVL